MTIQEVKQLEKKYGVRFDEYREFDLDGIGKLFSLGARKANSRERDMIDCNPDNTVIVLPEGIFCGATFSPKTPEELAAEERQAELDRKIIQ